MLLRNAGILVQGYQSGGVIALQSGPEQVVALRPNIVYVNLCTYGYGGPWANHRSFNSFVQTVSGFN